MRRRRKRQVDSYRSYLRRVLTSVHPDLGISQKGMEILNSMTHDMYERITTEAARLLRITGAPSPVHAIATARVRPSLNAFPCPIRAHGRAAAMRPAHRQTAADVGCSCVS